MRPISISRYIYVTLLNKFIVFQIFFILCYFWPHNIPPSLEKENERSSFLLFRLFSLLQFFTVIIFPEYDRDYNRFLLSNLFLVYHCVFLTSLYFSIGFFFLSFSSYFPNYYAYYTGYNCD